MIHAFAGAVMGSMNAGWFGGPLMVLFLLGFPLLFGWATASLVRSKGGRFSSGCLLGFFLGPLGLILAGMWKPDPRRRPHHSPFEAAGTQTGGAETGGMAPNTAAAFARAETGRRWRLWLLAGIVAFYTALWTVYLIRADDGASDGTSTPTLELVATIGVFAGAIYAFLSPRLRRRRAMRRAASRLGLWFAPRDPFNLLAIPVPVFRAQRAQLRNVLWGTWGERNVVVFDNGYDPACLVQIDLDCPPIALYPENRVSVALHASGLRDIEFESEEFNRAFTVKCDDRRFANALIDGRMMAWLLEDRSRWGFEMVTGWAFCAGWGEPSQDPEPLLGSVTAFVGHIPRAVWDLYRPQVERAKPPARPSRSTRPVSIHDERARPGERS